MHHFVAIYAQDGSAKNFLAFRLYDDLHEAMGFAAFASPAD